MSAALVWEGSRMQGNNLAYSPKSNTYTATRNIITEGGGGGGGGGYVY
jgi:hypothetical protein